MKVDKPYLNRITAVLILLRCYIGFIDIEERRHTNSELFNSIWLVGALSGLGN